MRHRRQTWLITRWSKKHRQDALDAAAAAQEIERRAARQRILEQATVTLPALPARAAPLLTRGQLDRSRRCCG